MPRERVLEHVEQFRRETEERLAELRAIEPTSMRQGHDEFHYFLLRLGIERAEHALAWSDWVLRELRARVQ
jgi:predicted amidohydrolase YtcJ